MTPFKVLEVSHEDFLCLDALQHITNIIQSAFIFRHNPFNIKYTDQLLYVFALTGLAGQLCFDDSAGAKSES